MMPNFFSMETGEFYFVDMLIEEVGELVQREREDYEYLQKLLHLNQDAFQNASAGEMSRLIAKNPEFDPPLQRRREQTRSVWTNDGKLKTPDLMDSATASEAFLCAHGWGDRPTIGRPV